MTDDDVRYDGNKIFHKEMEAKCSRCGFDMVDLQACHSRCHNCGNEVTCADV